MSFLCEINNTLVCDGVRINLPMVLDHLHFLFDHGEYDREEYDLIVCAINSYRGGGAMPGFHRFALPDSHVDRFQTPRFYFLELMLLLWHDVNGICEFEVEPEETFVEPFHGVWDVDHGRALDERAVTNRFEVDHDMDLFDFWDDGIPSDDCIGDEWDDDSIITQ